MKKRISVIISIVVLLLTNSFAVSANSGSCEDELDLINLISLAEKAKAGKTWDNEVVVLNETDRNVTSEFLNWYGDGKSENDVSIYLNAHQYSFLETTINKSARGINAFETKNASRTFIDRFSGTFADQPSGNILFYTTVSGTISFNANTYDVVSVYGASVTSVYSGDILNFVNFYADGFSTSTSISADRTYGNVTGNCSLYANVYPDNPLVSQTKLISRVSHTLQISA